MMSPQARRSAAGLAFAIGLSLVGFQGALAQSAPPSPEHVKELYFDAARAGRVDLLEGLIKAGMNPNEHDPRGFTPLILAAFKGDSKVADRLLTEHCDVNAANNVGQTALMMAALFGRTEIVRLLIAHG